MGDKSNRGFGRVLARISKIALEAARRMAAEDELPVSVWLHRLVMAEDKRRRQDGEIEATL